MRIDTRRCSKLHARIDACTDLPTLERWLDRAITAGCIADVLG
jgi:hypothetical protein